MQTKIILEIGCNHNGSIELAKQMIDDAAKLGVWGVKFQKRDPESMSEGEKLIPRKQENSFGVNYYEHRKALEFSVEQVETLIKYAKSKSLIVGVSVFDMNSAKQMANIDFDFIKLPSQFYSHYALNKYLLERRGIEFPYNFGVIVSTGMHSFDELINWQYFDKFNVTMYCRSIYPCSLTELNFNMMSNLKNKLKNSEIGYSSHEKNGLAIGQAVLLGAKYIERHYTLDKSMKGSDHKTVSSDFVEMQRIIEDVNIAESLLYESDNFNELSSENEKRVRMVYRGF